jgi:hypothetical protein
VRTSSVGLPLTLAQYEALSANVLVERLVSRRHHLLAMKLCGFLNLRPDPVCVDWACQKIVETPRIGEGDSSDDQRLHDQVMGLLRGYSGIKYTAVASSAYRSGRPDLAVMFLEHEPRVLEQVPLLMSMRKHELALEKAVLAGETNLIHLSLLQLRKQSRDVQLTDFFRVVERSPVALRHLVALWKRRGTDYDTLKLLFFHLQQPQEAAHTAVIEAYRSREWDKRLRRLKMAGEFYGKNKEYGFCKSMTEEQTKLLEYQRILEQANMKVGDETAVIDRPLSTNIINLIKKKAHVQAGDLVKKFKVPSRPFLSLPVLFHGRAQKLTSHADCLLSAVAFFLCVFLSFRLATNDTGICASVHSRKSATGVRWRRLPTRKRALSVTGHSWTHVSRLGQSGRHRHMSIGYQSMTSKRSAASNFLTSGKQLSALC